MFTGIVEEIGEVLAVQPLDGAARLSVRGPTVAAGTAAGDSVAVNGVCLSVTALADGAFTADVMAETLRRSGLGQLAPGEPVNLERALTPTTRLGGHLVQGHVDGLGTLLERVPAEHWETLRIALPAELARYVVRKGSIAVDGVSLTVVEAAADAFTVSLIPTTLHRTTLGRRAPGAVVNLEVDVLAKYVEKLLGSLQGSAS